MTEHRLHSRTALQLSLTLLPCGAVEPEELDHLAALLSAKGMRVAVAREQPIPPAAFKTVRQQYRADSFLKLARNEPGERVLAITNCDLYADNLNFVFGMADSPGRCAVISFCRLRMGVDRETFRRRAAKEAVHELGHTLGLAHCANPHCVMFFSNSLAHTDRKGIDWCVACECKVEKNYGYIPISQKTEVRDEHGDSKSKIRPQRNQTA